MPVLNETINNRDEVSDILNEISGIIGSYSSCQIIIGGDFNFDFNRDQSSQLFNIFIDFIIRENLLTNFETFNSSNFSFTYESSNNIRSNIDHFIFSDCILDNVDNFKIIVDGHNLSDHNPIYIEYKIDSNFDYIKNVNENNVMKYDWNTATKKYIDLY